MTTSSRPLLHLVPAPQDRGEAADWTWFCGHCAAPAPSDAPPAPTARVCTKCGLGLLLETRHDAAPSSRHAFLVIDGGLRLQALSSAGEKLLRVREQTAVNRPLREFLVAADAEAGSHPLERLIADALDGEAEPRWTQVRPANTFGVRMRARIAPCGPPRAALIVLGAVRPVD